MNLKFDEKNSFCISLNSELNKRWAKLNQKLLEQFNFKVTRWEASTPETLTDKFVDYLKPTERACTQSHLNLWRHMVQNNIEYALILEDDACFRKDWLEKIKIMNIQDPAWHAIFLNVTETCTPLETWVLAHEQLLTGGYILSKQGAFLMLWMFKDCFYMCDWMTSRLQLLQHSYTYFPWLIIQEGKESSLRDQQGVDADHAKVIRLLASVPYDLNNYI